MIDISEHNKKKQIQFNFNKSSPLPVSRNIKEIKSFLYETRTYPVGIEHVPIRRDNKETFL